MILNLFTWFHSHRSLLSVVGKELQAGQYHSDITVLDTGHAARCGADFIQTRNWHEKPLGMALAARDKIGEGQACSKFGIIYQLIGDYDGAMNYSTMGEPSKTLEMHIQRLGYISDTLIISHFIFKSIQISHFIFESTESTDPLKSTFKYFQRIQRHS